MHIPVMVEEVLRHLAPAPEETYLDATFGGGGHARKILEFAPCRLLAFDRDPNAKVAAERLMHILEKSEQAGSKQSGLFMGLSCTRFSRIQDTVASYDLSTVDGILADFGVSSMQLDESDRGFSFREDGPLDMRMGNNDFSAQDLIAESTEEDLFAIIKFYGEERHARKIARSIVAYRKQQQIKTTATLADIVRSAIPKASSYGARALIDPATKTFQAIRIAVNNELEEIRAFLETTASLLKPGGRLVIISFHSLEDRIVKHFMKTASGDIPRNSRHHPDVQSPIVPDFILPFKKPLTPSNEEIQRNPRARSARMRVALRCS